MFLSDDYNQMKNSRYARESPRGEVAEVFDYDIVVSGFKL